MEETEAVCVCVCVCVCVRARARVCVCVLFQYVIVCFIMHEANLNLQAGNDLFSILSFSV